MTKEYKNWLFVEVRENASRIVILPNGALRYFATANWVYIKLPPGSWLIVGMSGQLGEEEAKWIVDPNNEDDGLYHNYHLSHEKSTLIFVATATESLASLIESMGMKNNCTLILKKK